MGNITQKWVSVLYPFTEDYFANLSASEISKKSQIPQQTASRILNLLVKNNLLDYQDRGKNKEFYFEPGKVHTDIVFNIIENQKSLDFLYKEKKIGVMINEMIKLCDSLIIFGSYSSGKGKNTSDLDLVVLNVKNKEIFKKNKRKYSLEVNVHFVTYNELVKLLRVQNPLSIEIKKNHIFIGEISKLVRIFKNG